QFVHQEARQRSGVPCGFAQRFRAFGAYEGVRVLSFGQEQEGERGVITQGFERGLERAPGSLATGLVAVEAEDDAVGVAQQALYMMRRGGRAERGHGVADAE